VVLLHLENLVVLWVLVDQYLEHPVLPLNLEVLQHQYFLEHLLYLEVLGILEPLEPLEVLGVL
jgi:hypothetical protein